MRIAEAGIEELQKCVDTLIVIPNQNLFRVANEKTTFADAFAMADQVLYSGVACITDLMVKEGLINLDFADVRSVMREMGKAMMGTGEASGEKRAHGRRRGRDRQSAARRDLDEGRQGPADLDHRRPGPDAVRGRRGRDPHPRGGRPGRQHHPRRDLRRRASKASSACRSWRPASTRSRPRSVRRPRRRIAELTQKLRADTQRLGRAHRARRAHAQRPLQRRQRAGAAPQPAPMRSSSAATAAVAAALLPIGADEDVTIRPIPPKPSLFVGAGHAEPAPQETPAPRASSRRSRSVPPAAPPRMPRIDELPMPAQNEMRAKRGEATETEHPEKQRMSLLQRLAPVGLGRRDEGAEKRRPAGRRGRAAAARPRAAAAPRHAARRDRRSRAARSRSPNTPAPRRPRQGLDPHGRQAPVHNPRRTISSRSRRSCAARPTERASGTANGPGATAGTGRRCRPVVASI